MVSQSALLSLYPYITTFIFSSQHLLLASVDAALLLFQRLTAKLREYMEQHLEVLMMSMTIVLSSLSRVTQFIKKGRVNEILAEATQTLQKWVIHVFNGPMFGGRVKCGSLAHSTRELKVPMYNCTVQKAVA